MMAAEIRAAISAELGLTASAGVAPNKFLAKLASGAAQSLTACSSSAPGGGRVRASAPLWQVARHRPQDGRAAGVPRAVFVRRCPPARQRGADRPFRQAREMLAGRIWGMTISRCRPGGCARASVWRRRSPATCWTRTPAGRCLAGSFPSWSSVFAKACPAEMLMGRDQAEVCRFSPDHRLSQGVIRRPASTICCTRDCNGLQESPFACSVWSLVCPER